MAEYIRREDYCEENCGKENREGYKTCTNCGMLNIPSADVQPVDRWISVKDRLPEVDKQVLVYIKKPDDLHDNVEKVHLSDKSDDEYPYWVFKDGRFYSTRFRYVTHWQPLPKPPKED